MIRYIRASVWGVCVSTKRKISILGILERFYKYCNGKAVAELTKRRLHL